MTSSTSSSSSSSSATGVDAPPPAAASTVVEYSEVQFGRIALQIKEALHRYWLEETKANNSGFDDGAHVILILDKHLQTFPWESCPGLRSEAVSRVPSMCFLRDRILQQKYLISKEERGEQWGSEWRDLEVDPQKTFYVLNPEGDLKNTEDEFKEYVGKQQGWDGIIGRAPLDLECIDGLSKNDLYIYFGHSGGEQYVKSTQIRQLGHCAVSLLLGCSSGQMRGGGEFDPTGNAMNYLLAGCPTVVANLWDVTDKDLDRFSMAAFREDETQEMEGIEGSGEAKESDKTQLSLVEAVKEAREECRLKYLVGAASVVYGIPCFLKRSST
ncbi:peptidase family C50-domain-containing protein [Gamsiella multidivaricata]|uniref:peptidase family C50-domain-containing protein n=1 Tax=Gamsiella multidivaricata TaxID=101098 RepID=UPI00221F30B4|nr:peptidase family C50-domain-containing protein [Gamsiella multidivaricata]KAI7816937.1 peptidase family C50-domain-containing protein [Gamsiella multidivaricata]